MEEAPRDGRRVSKLFNELIISEEGDSGTHQISSVSVGHVFYIVVAVTGMLILITNVFPYLWLHALVISNVSSFRGRSRTPAISNMELFVKMVISILDVVRVLDPLCLCQKTYQFANSKLKHSLPQNCIECIFLVSNSLSVSHVCFVTTNLFFQTNYGESGLGGYGVVIIIGRFPVQTPPGALPGLGTHPCYEAPSDLRVKLKTQ